MARIAMKAGADDEQLVAATRNGDDRAFEELYGRYRRRIAAYVHGMVNDYGRAEDITQEIFVSALRRIRATERPIAFKPWIYEIARNACIDQFRRSRRTEEVSFDAEDASGALDAARVAGAATPDAAMHTKQQIDDLCGAFTGLSEAHHEILVMRELEGLSYREIGDRLGLSRPSVESTLFRARRRLTEEYQELVSGERCRRVSELLASGATALGAREERRLARHVAHCQPCRRQAYAAGVDTATLTRQPRRTVARVAAFLPLPAFLRFRGGNAASWSNSAATMAEPAAGWAKAAVAAAVLVAGGAGVAGHSPSPVPGAGTAKPAAVGPQAEDRLKPARASQARPPAAPARTAQTGRASERAQGTLRPGAGAPAPAEGAAPAAKDAPQVVDAAPAPEAPSAGSVDAGPPQLPAPRLEPTAPTDGDGDTKSDPAVVVPQSPQQAYAQLESAVTKVDGNAGAVLEAAGQATGLGG